MQPNQLLNTLTTCQSGTLTKVSVVRGFALGTSVLIYSEYEPLVPFEHVEHGKNADPSFPNLLKTAKVTQFTSNIGAEVTGVQLSQLTKEGRDELALFVAQNKVVGEPYENRCCDQALTGLSLPQPRLCRSANPRCSRLRWVLREAPCSSYERRS